MSDGVRSNELMKIAHSLGMTGRWNDPIEYLRTHCLRVVEQWIRDYEPDTLDDLLETALAVLGVCVEEVHEDADLRSLCDRYVGNGELGFERVRREFDARTFALVVRLRVPLNGCTHVAVIDCRGPKAARRWFSKWHEIAHLLTQPQLELNFRRCDQSEKDPVETCMDQIAGDLAFYEPLCRLGELSEARFDLENLEVHRAAYMSQSSREAAYSSIVKRVDFPALFVIGELALNAEQRRHGQSGSLFPGAQSQPVLRAVRIARSPSAQSVKLFIPNNMRVPKRSIIHAVYQQSFIGLMRERRLQRENLDWWSSSRGGELPFCRVVVEAVNNGPRVFGLVKLDRD